MSGTLNKVMLIGHLGDAVKIHYFDEANCAARFSIATNESFVSKKTGQVVVNTEWHTVVVRNKTAENCEKYLAKGDKVYVEGKIKSREWQSDEGVSKKVYEIHANEVTFLSPKQDKKEEGQADNSSEGESHGLPF